MFALFVNAETATVFMGLVLAFRRIIEANCMDTATTVIYLDSRQSCRFYRQRLCTACVYLVSAKVLGDLTFDVDEPQIAENIVVGPLDTFE